MKIVIHISGPSGSGKTTLGFKIKEYYNSNVIVKDLDDLRDEFIKKTYDTTQKWSLNEIEYQNYINNFIVKYKKPIIFVGLSDNPSGNKQMYYDVHANYKYFIGCDDNIILERKCKRMFQNLQNDKIAMNDLVNNNEKFLKTIKNAIDQNCNLNNTIASNKKWKDDYELQGYVILSPNIIFSKIKAFINKYISKK